MSFAAVIEARLAVINRMIPAAKMAERRKLQRERTDLEDKLQRADTAQATKERLPND